MKRIKQFFIISAVFYAILTMILSLACYLGEVMIGPVQSFRLALMAGSIAAVTILREQLDKKQWMMRISYFVKRLIAAPVYLAITLLTYYNFGYPMDDFSEDAILIIISFCLAFLIFGGIRSIYERRKVGNYMKKITAYQLKVGESETSKIANKQ